MQKEQLIKIINKLKEYGLYDYFKNQEEFKKWIISLSNKQINNFLSLTIKSEEYEFPSSLLIDENLLNCDDYSERVKALSILHNGDGCWHLFGALIAPNFLKSEKWYKDVELISHAEEARYALWVVGEDAFINSPYHDEDLELIVNAKDNSLDEDGNERHHDYVIADALALVAKCPESINSKYHREDMKMIANAGSRKLQMMGSCPDSSINRLAMSEISLSDTHHLENMKILLDSKLEDGDEYIYNLFTNPNVISSKDYDEIRKAVSQVGEDITALALYSYIINFNYIDDWSAKEIIGTYDLYFKLPNEVLPYHTRFEENTLKNINPKFLEYISSINGPISLYVSYLLSNDNFVNSPSIKEDLDFIIANFSSNCDYDKLNFIISALVNPNFINSPYHKVDLTIINNGVDKETIYLLMSCATNIDNVQSPNHGYDMNYILSLNAENLNNKMRHFIFQKDGIHNPKHIEYLENLAHGEDIAENIFDSIDGLYQYIEEPIEIQEQSQLAENSSNKILQRVKKFIKSRV